MLYVGTNYHPHDWSADRWETDLSMMKEAGFTTVRLGHLCWDSYEPENGVYTFEWFDAVMDLCTGYGLQVVLDVSMHPAPRWVHRLCPGCNVGGKNVNPQAPLRRYMEDVSDEAYQHYALRFAETLVRRYKDHPALFAFGLCNELGAGFPSYAESSRVRFTEWLRRKYGTIEALNEAWATRRWSRRVSSFEEIPLQENEYAVGAPEAWLDMRRFFSDGIAGFITSLKETVEKNAPGKPHSSNHYAEYETLGFDYLKACSGFADHPGIGFYPGYDGRDSIRWQRTCSEYIKRMAESDQSMWCLEFVTGGVGILHDHVGINRMYAFWCLLHRAQMVLGWTWRSMLNGEEQFLNGMLNHDGQPNPNYEEYVRIAQDFRKLSQYAFPYLPTPEIAVSYSYDSKLEAQYSSKHFRLPYGENLGRVHAVLEEKNLDYNVVDLHEIRKEYRVLVIAGQNMLDQREAENVRAFVQNGGTVVMTGYSAVVDETGRVYDTPRPGLLTDVFGIHAAGFGRTSGTEHTREEEALIARNAENGHELLYVGSAPDADSLTELDAASLTELDVDYYEELVPEDAEVAAWEVTHGIPAVTVHPYGKGKAIYLFCETECRLVGQVIESLQENGVLSRGIRTPKGVIARQLADGQRFYLNLTNQRQQIPLEAFAGGQRVLQGDAAGDSLTLEPYDGELVVR